MWEIKTIRKDKPLFENSPAHAAAMQKKRAPGGGGEFIQQGF